MAHGRAIPSHSSTRRSPWRHTADNGPVTAAAVRNVKTGTRVRSELSQASQARVKPAYLPGYYKWPQGERHLRV